MIPISQNIQIEYLLSLIYFVNNIFNRGIQAKKYQTHAWTVNIKTKVNINAFMLTHNALSIYVAFSRFSQ